MTITKFGDGGSYSYTFTYVQNYSDNFKDARAQVDKLMGVTGGISQYGRRSPPRETGKVTLSFMLRAYNRADMGAKRDTINKMLTWGEQLLWMQPTNYPTDVIRFCRATINNIQMPESPAKQTDLIQPVTIIFQVPESRWLSYPGAGVWYWDDGSVWDTPTWVEPRYASTSINASSTISLTNNGNTHTPLVIRVKATNNVTNLEMNLLSETGAILNGWRYETVLASATADLLTINGENLSVLHDQTTGSGISSGYDYFKRLGGNGFIALPPGTWTLEVNGTFVGNVSVEIEYYDAWS